MSRYSVLSIALCLTLMEGAAQGQNFLKQLERGARQAINQQRQGSGGSTGQQKSYGSSSLPTEGGQRTGGGSFRPGNGFMLPGGQQRNQSNSLPSEGGRRTIGGEFQPGNGFLLPGNGVQPNPGRVIYPGNQPYPGSGQPIYGNQPGTGQVIYGQPIDRTTQYGSSTNSGSAVPTAPVSTSQYVTIRCPQSANGSIYYPLESDRGNFGFTMRGGQEQRFRVSSNWKISYNDGSSQKRYRLTGGKTYTLKNEGSRWQLYSVRAAGS